MTPYNVVEFNLATDVTALPLRIQKTDGKQVRYITILRCPVGANAFLRIGSVDADDLLIVVNRVYEICPAEPDGIFWWNPVAGAGIVEIVLSYDASELKVSNQ